MSAGDPDSVFEPIEGMLYVGTTRSRRAMTVKVLRASPQTVLYMPVGRGAKGEKLCKSSRSKFIHCHAPAPRTPCFASVVTAEAGARAEVRTLAVPVTEPAPTPPKSTQDTTQEPPVPAVAAEPPARQGVRFTREQIRELYQLAADVPEGMTRYAHYRDVARAFGCSDSYVAMVVNGGARKEWTADLRARPAALRVVPRAEAAPAGYPTRSRTPAADLVGSPAQDQRLGRPGQVHAAQGQATVPVPRHGDGPPPPTGLADIGEAARLLGDSAELMQTMARCILRRRPLPSYLSLKTVEDLAGRCEEVAERLVDVGRS